MEDFIVASYLEPRTALHPDMAGRSEPVLMTVAAFFGCPPRLEWRMQNADARKPLPSDSRHLLGTFEDMQIARQVVCQLHPDLPQDRNFALVPLLNGEAWETGQLAMAPKDAFEDQNLLLHSGSFWARLLGKIETQPAEVLQLAISTQSTPGTDYPNNAAEYWLRYHSSALRVTNVFLTVDPKIPYSYFQSTPTPTYTVEIADPLPMPESSFDAICDHGILTRSNITQLEFYLAQYNKVLRTGGLLYVRTASDIPLTPDHSGLEVQRIQTAQRFLRTSYLGGVLQDDLQSSLFKECQYDTVSMSNVYRNIVLKRHGFEIMSSGEHLWDMNSSFLCKKVAQGGAIKNGD